MQAALVQVNIKQDILIFLINVWNWQIDDILDGIRNAIITSS